MDQQVNRYLGEPEEGDGGDPVNNIAAWFALILSAALAAWLTLGLFRCGAP